MKKTYKLFTWNIICLERAGLLKVSVGERPNSGTLVKELKYRKVS